MTDTFSIALVMTMSAASDVWDGAARVQALFQSEFDGKYSYTKWEAGDVGRTFRRRNLAELRELVTPFKLDMMWVDTYFHGTGMHVYASVDGRVFEKHGDYSVTVDFNGAQRLEVERDAHTMQSALEREGRTVVRGQLEISSRDDGEAEFPVPQPKPVSVPAEALAASVPLAAEPSKVGTTDQLSQTKQLSRAKRSLAFVGDHLVRIITTAVAGVVVIAVAAWLGLNSK